MKRLLAILLCLSMVLCILPATAEAATYTYNWGAREDVADTTDFTRSTAEEWYVAQGTSYEELAQLSGSKTQSSVPSSALYQRLKTLMTTAHKTKTSYDGTKSMYQYTDCQNGGGKISSFYSGNAIGPAWGQGSWNREHTWPKSKSLNGSSDGGQDETDIMMLRPTSTSENSSRGNTAYGESYYDPNDESGGKYNLHGDVARIVLYVYVRWGNTQYMWGGSGVMESRATLLKWMEEDPVDTWELGRNDSVESITGTRNVFVDYPELGFLLFGESVPAGYESPSASGNLTSYQITATSSNTAYGTVSLSGKTITATPKTGYYVAGYTVTSGTAQVIQNGNTFQVVPSSDCSVRINFAAKTSVQVRFSENGVISKTVSAYGGDSLTLPSNTAALAEGFHFLGWTDGSLSDTTQKPTYLTAGTTVTAANKTYYALYTYAVGGTGEIGYTRKEIADIKPGDAFVITMAKGGTIYALPNATAASTGPVPVTVTGADGKLTGDIAPSLLWNLGGSSDAWEFYPHGETARWLGCIGDNNGVRVSTEANKTFKISGDYLVNIGTGRFLGVYENKPDWRCYTSSSTNIGGQTVGLYVKGENGTAWYTSYMDICEHEDTGASDPVAATCTEIGYTTGVYCNDCDSFISGHEEIPALGHAWSAWVETTAPTCTAAGVETATCSRCDEEKSQSVAATGHSYSSVITPPTVTDQGYTTYTCASCGHSYQGDYTEALGETFTVTFRVPAGVAAVAPMTCTKDGITLPAATAPEGYSFLGWSVEIVKETEAKPEILTGSYNATANVTLHALYSFVESDGDQPSGVYTLYSGEITEGDYIFYTKTDAMKAAILSGRIGTVAATVTGDTITNPDETIVWHVAKTEDGYYTIYNEANGVYAAGTGAKNKGTLLTSVTDYAKWTVSGSSTYEFVNKGNKANGINANLRWNSETIGWGTYASSFKTAPQLYKGSTGITYYTTLTMEAAAEVDGVAYETLAAACENANGGTVKLLQDAEAVTVEGAVYLDLNGYTAELNAEKLFVMDSTATTAAAGKGRLITESAVSQQWGSFATLDTGDGYRAHKLELKLTAVTLRTAKAGIYYKASLNCDPELQANIGAYGVTLSVEDGKAVSTRYTGVPTGEFTSGSVFNIFRETLSATHNAVRGEMDIFAVPYVELMDGTVLQGSSGTSYSLRAVLEEINDNFDSLTAEEQAQVTAFCTTWSAVLSTWN